MERGRRPWGERRRAKASQVQRAQPSRAATTCVAACAPGCPAVGRGNPQGCSPKSPAFSRSPLCFAVSPAHPFPPGVERAQPSRGVFYVGRIPLPPLPEPARTCPAFPQLSSFRPYAPFSRGGQIWGPSWERAFLNFSRGGPPEGGDPAPCSEKIIGPCDKTRIRRARTIPRQEKRSRCR